MTNLKPGFKQSQRDFLAYLRDPGSVPLPGGLSGQRMMIYAELLYNKFNDSLAACFPVTQAWLGKAGWKRLLESFIAQHRCLSPCYRQIPDEFIRYLETGRREANDPPFLVELAHFEWVEMILAVADDEPVSTRWIAPVTDWLAYRPVFAPVMRLLHYAYPVHRIHPGYKPSFPPEQATHILGFRNVDDSVEFIELSPATARLLAILQTTGCTGNRAVLQLAEELQIAEPSSLLSFVADALAELMRQGVFLGAEAVDFGQLE